MKEETQIGVIGSGLGGLAAACTLAARGASVVLFEKNPWLGGKAAALEDGGFRFDMGPTILTLPSVLRRIYSEADRNLDDELPLIQLDPQWRCFFEDGSTLDLLSDIENMCASLQEFSKDKGAGTQYRDFLSFSEKLHGISERFFFWKSVGSLFDTFEMGTTFQISVLKDVMAMRPGHTVSSTIRSFVDDERVTQMLDHFTQYVGSAPDASPAVLCGIAHMQTQEGIWYPKGGIRAVPQALEKLARDLNVTIRTETGVKRILTETTAKSERVCGVLLDSGEEVRLSAVVSNMDSVLTHRNLLSGKPSRRFEKRRKYEPACSGVVLYLGLDRGYEHLLHHNFVFSGDPEEEFEWIYRKGEPAPDPTCYVAAPARSDDTVAPPGGEALYVLVHTPFLRSHHDWNRMLPSYRRTILNKLERTAGLEGLEDRIVTEHALTPEGIRDRYRVLDGAIYGLASHGKFLGAFKPANRSQDVQGLYLAGGAAHPGPGMPMVLMSGWIAADSLCQDGLVKGESVELAATK